MNAASVVGFHRSCYRLSTGLRQTPRDRRLSGELALR